MKREQNLNISVTLEDQRMKQVGNFTYLGSVRTADGRSEKWINRRRIGAARAAYRKMRSMPSIKSMNLLLSSKLLKYNVWYVATRMLRPGQYLRKWEKELKQQKWGSIEECRELPCVKRMTDEEGLRRVGVGKELMRTVGERQITFLGHALGEDGLEKTALRGRTAGRRGRGR